MRVKTDGDYYRTLKHNLCGMPCACKAIPAAIFVRGWLYGVVSPIWRGYVGFGTGAGRKQSFFYATVGQAVTFTEQTGIAVVATLDTV